jgi:hypothetical protein
VLKDNPDLARQVLPDRVHPGPAGHVVMGAALLRAWKAPPLVTRVAIDAASKAVVAAEGSEVSVLAATDGGLAWTQKDRALPLPLGFEDGETELAQRAGADLESLDQQPLVVTGLAAGVFELKIDGQSIGTFTDAELAKGVNLARFNTPMRWQAFSVKWSVGGGHEAQRVRRELLVAAAKDPSLKAAAEALARRDEAEQRQRSVDATPKPRRYELIRHSSNPGGPGGRISRSRPFSTFPMAFRGSASTRTNARGTLKDAICRRQAASSAAGSASPAKHATSTSPRRSSGTPSTAASRTPACSRRTASTSRG